MDELADLPDPEDPATALAAVVSMRRAADRLELAAVQVAIDDGWSWALIADSLGVTPQAAHKRLASRVGKSSTRKASR
ncbi:MAG: helix-turn-helix domain-containing protein [bacterium]|nr:helix-turn-helix domain-containing protein [bacterium]